MKLHIMSGAPKCVVDFEPTGADHNQAERNHSQSLRRLNERGGLAWNELLAVLEHREWKSVPSDEAEQRCREILAKRKPPVGYVYQLPIHMDANGEAIWERQISFVKPENQMFRYLRPLYAGEEIT